jgi:hypothetical protein
MSAFGLLSDLSTKVLNFSEDAHIETTSIFETDEHLQLSADRWAVGHSCQKA